MSESMAPEQDPGQKPPTTDLTEELGNLGKNLVGILRAAWDRPERQKLQQEIQGGINELGSTLRKEAKAVSENPVSQRIKTEVEDLGSRVRSGQVDAKVREELVGALHALNTELEKVSTLLTANAAPEAEGPGEAAGAGASVQAGSESAAVSAEPGDAPKAKAKRKPKAKAEAKAVTCEDEAQSPESGAAPVEDSPKAG